MNPGPRERETGVPCPKCRGEGALVLEDGKTFQHGVCDFCLGVGIVSVAAMGRWKTTYASGSEVSSMAAKKTSKKKTLTKRTKGSAGKIVKGAKKPAKRKAAAKKEKPAEG